MITLSTNAKSRSCHVGQKFHPVRRSQFSTSHCIPPLKNKLMPNNSMLKIQKLLDVVEQRRQKWHPLTAVSMAVPLTHSSQRRVPSSDAFFKPLPIRPSKVATACTRSSRRFEVKESSLKEKAVTELTAAVLTASMVIPEVAEAAESGISPCLKNLLLSIVAGGVVLGVIVGAVIGVANFDPVKRTRSF